MSQVRFSERYGFDAPIPPITVRHAAPIELRSLVAEFAYERGLKPSDLRPIVCRVLLTSPDSSNWSEFPNIAGEVEEQLRHCDWFYVFDIMEEVLQTLRRRDAMLAPAEGTAAESAYAAQLNSYFVRKGVGWQVRDGKVDLAPQMRRTDLVSTFGRGATPHGPTHLVLCDL